MVLGASLLSVKYDATARLLKGAISYYQLLFLYLNSDFNTEAISTASKLNAIYTEVENRTRKFYQTGSPFEEPKVFAALHKSVLVQHPLDKYKEWQYILQNKKSVIKGYIDSSLPFEILERVEQNITEGQFSSCVPELKLQLDGIKTNVLNYSTSEMPLVQRVIFDLSKLTVKSVLENIQRQNAATGYTDSIF